MDIQKLRYELKNKLAFSMDSELCKCLLKNKEEKET